MIPKEYYTIIATTELLEWFEGSLGMVLCPEDQFELFHQLFQLLDKHTPLDMVDRNILAFDSLIFANHLTVDHHQYVDKLAYHLLVRLWQMVTALNFYVNGELMYFPQGMHGTDLFVRRYNS